ncbi:hypothetical protein L4Z68_001429 [Pseudomonas aeruginosa]|nr:hypothetical protein [Pseudomonas aeruginosa]EKX2969435.1 hypothetical protein [Pseudomonas aeruginosa]HBO8004196.1 hypothetical protein [Pseudomonas aeruginosa]
MKSIPKAAVTALKSYNPNAKAFYLHADGRIGAKYNQDSFQWVRHEAPFGFVDAGMSRNADGAERVKNVA